MKKSVATNDAPQYQELRCRGGGLRFVVVNGRTTSSGEQTMYMTVDFQHAAQAAGLVGRNLQPGQCSFPDRALRTDEPDQIVQEIVSFGQLKERLHGSAVDNSPTAAERYPDSKNVPQYLSDAKYYWSFYVHQNGPLPSGRFESSYSRYWKPGGDPVRPVDSTRTNRGVLTPKPDNKSAVVTGQVGSAPTKLNAKLVNDGSQFQLICRGGPALRVSTKRVQAPDGSWIRSDWLITFNQSTQPARSGRNLQPGQCGPAEFRLSDNAPTAIQTEVNDDGSLPEVGLYPWEKSSLEDANKRLGKFIEYLKDPQNYWSFFVKDDGEGEFMANYSQYWKPDLYKGPTVSPVDSKRINKDVLTPNKP